MGIIERASPFRILRPRSDYEAWDQANRYAFERAALVKGILDEHIKCEGLSILNLGPDYGSVPRVFPVSNNITNFDSSFLRLNKQEDAQNYSRVDGDYVSLPFRDNSFNIIIIQNIIEQIYHIDDFIKDLNRVLNRGGIIYLSTTNKLSLFNIIKSPYNGMPLSVLFTREITTGSSKGFFRFLSLAVLKEQFNNFQISINTTRAINLLINNSGLTATSSHPGIIKFIKAAGLSGILLKLANNKSGFINKFVMPTFYLILKKIQS